MHLSCEDLFTNKQKKHLHTKLKWPTIDEELDIIKMSTNAGMVIRKHPEN